MIMGIGPNYNYDLDYEYFCYFDYYEYYDKIV